MSILHVYDAFPLLVMQYSAACPRCFSAACPLHFLSISTACQCCLLASYVKIISKNVLRQKETPYNISVCKIRKNGSHVASFSHESRKNSVKTLVLKASFAVCVNIKK
jgi:hypothetical protein